MRLFGAIEKFEKLSDGTLIVEGVASSDSLDASGERITAQAIRDATPEYMKFANVREMHQASAVGRTLKMATEDDGKTYVSVKVVDPVAIKKVEEKVYNGFSIGGKTLARDPKCNSDITKIKLSEISLADRPMNPECLFKVWTEEIGVELEKKAKEEAKEGEHEYDHEDHYSKYGDVEYADPFHHKYPIDTEAHVRAALSYFAMARNKNKYSPGDQARIHGRIAAAAHKHGITLSADETKKLEDFMNEQLIAKVDALTNSMTALLIKVEALEKRPAVPESLLKIEGVVTGLKTELDATRTAAESAARTGIIEKMHSEGRYPVNPETNVAYKDDELQKLDLPTLKLLKANSRILPMQELSKVNGEVKEEKLLGRDGKELVGLAKVEAAAERMLADSPNGFNRLSVNGR